MTFDNPYAFGDLPEVREALERAAETFLVIPLTADLELADSPRVASIGTKDRTIIDPGELLRLATMSNCTRVAVLHTHPSGSPLPSDADIDFTYKIEVLMQMHGIDLVDHLIAAKSRVDRAHVDIYSLSAHADWIKDPRRVELALRRLNA